MCKIAPQIADRCGKGRIARQKMVGWALPGPSRLCYAETVMGTARASHPDAPVVRPPGPPVSGRRGLDILLVDDDPDMRSLTSHYLRAAGHHVVSAGDGAEATALLG